MTASSTLTTLADAIIGTMTSFATTIITNYWPFVLVLIAVTGLIGIAYRFMHAASGKGR